ncbi:STAS domain-containing protein [Pelosinus sp. sgz500959]|uniref:STAS domain-containing protein n=1 Tax=Pelosinus sp. sgz500959 TaxID=3242472 RepID=UPI00366B6765
MKKQMTFMKKDLLVKLSGEMYLEDAEELRQELVNYALQGNNHLVIDMSELIYIDSSGIAALIAVNKSVLHSGGNVILINLCDNIKELFEITYLNKIFNIQVS